MDQLLWNLKGFQWDDGNRDKNETRHGVHFTECEQIFLNRPLFVLGDPKHSKGEERFAAFGATDRSRRLAVIFTVRGDLIRVISARDMNRRERRFYGEQSAKDTPVQD